MHRFIYIYIYVYIYIYISFVISFNRSYDLLMDLRLDSLGDSSLSAVVQACPPNLSRERGPRQQAKTARDFVVCGAQEVALGVWPSRIILDGSQVKTSKQTKSQTNDKNVKHNKKSRFLCMHQILVHAQAKFYVARVLTNPLLAVQGYT